MKKKCLIVMGYMTYGGIQKSLVNFLASIKDKVEVDLLLWGRTSDEMSIPEGVNILKVPTVKSVKAALRENGVFSKDFVLSCLGLLNQKRWLAMPTLTKHYDIAIAYPQVGFPKYYVIDRVKADKKYAFYHHGSYEFGGKMKSWDKEYYPKYDKLYCVSKHTQNILEDALGVDINYDIMPNLLNVESILDAGLSPCEEYNSSSGIKILTVARLSPEKNLHKCLSVAKRLVDNGVDFSWYMLGDGPLRSSLESEISSLGLDKHVYLLGNQPNPYRFMKNCDVYVQLSEYEADPITIKEVAVFDKPMVLSDIIAFRNAIEWINNISLRGDIESISTAIGEISSIDVIKNDLTKVNKSYYQKLNEIFDLKD